MLYIPGPCRREQRDHLHFPQRQKTWKVKMYRQASSKCLKVDLAVPSRPLASAHQPSPASRRYLFKSSSCPGFLSLKLNIYVAVKNVKGGILVGRSSPVSEPVTLRYDAMKLVLRFLKETPACKPSGHPPSGQSCHRGLCWHPWMPWNNWITLQYWEYC